MAYATLFVILLQVCTFINIVAISNDLLRPKFSSILAFGDSIVDTGNNNYIKTYAKVNHLPYGKDFPNHIPTGRFSNGKISIDFLASTLNLKDTVPPFLDSNLSNEELLTGVSFASGESGLDDLTIALSGAISIPNQIENFKDYVVKVKSIVGEEEAKERLENALVIINVGINDFLLNYYDIPTRRLEFNIGEYQDYLQSRLQIFIQELYDLGCRKIAVYGLPTIGCIPVQVTAKFVILKDRKCVENENLEAEIYNQKLARRLPQLQKVLPGSKVVYASIYDPLIDLINHPQKYGIKETNKGCCGTGLFETGPLCNKLTPVCDDASKYVFWDSIHPSEATYKYIAKYFELEVLPKL